MFDEFGAVWPDLGTEPWPEPDGGPEPERGEAPEHETEEWPELDEFDSHRAPVLPLDRLPAVVCDLARAVAASAQVAPEVPALMALGALAAVAQKTAKVRGSRWSEQLSLFVLVIADTGERKSPAYKDVVVPLRAIERRLDESTRYARMERNADRDLLADQVGATRKAMTSSKGTPDAAVLAELRSRLEALGPEEAAPRLYADDASLESLVSLIVTNGGRMGLLSPEASFLKIIQGAYQSGKATADLSALLSAFSGTEPLVIDRQGRVGGRADAPALSIVMVGQPKTLRDLMAVPGAEERGLLARFLIARADSRGGTRTMELEDAPDVADTPEGRAWAVLLDRLAEREVSDGPPELRLDAAALGLLATWHNVDLEPERCDPGRWRLILGFAAKAHGLALRLAGLFHLAEHPDAGHGDVIGAETMAAGIELAEWALVAHEHAVVGAGLSPEVSHALRVIKGAERGTLTGSKAEPMPWAPFTERDVSRLLGTSRAPVSVDDARRYLDLLASRGYIRHETAERRWCWRPGLGG